MKWYFRLDGDALDIADVTELFRDEAKFETDETQRIHLIMELDFDEKDSGKAQQVAEELLAKLNAIAQIIHTNHESVRVVGAGLKDSSTGIVHQFIHVSSSIICRSRVGVGLVIADSSEPPGPPPKAIGDRFLGTSDKDQFLERALFLYGSLPLDWRGLYMVLEAAEDGNGGEKKLIAKNWVPKGQVKDFKATANSYKALRLAARHGSTKEGIDQPAMTLPEAEEMVRNILEKWIKNLIV